MRITNYEDLIMKRAMDVFAEDGLKFFGIDKKVKELGPTELVVLESKNLHMDYTFLMEDDTYIHFEFQTTNKNISDLRRFRAYEALLSHQTGKDVVTYVIYSSNIINVNDTLETGINKFKVNTISMASKNGDDVFSYIVFYSSMFSGLNFELKGVASLFILYNKFKSANNQIEKNQR